MSMSRKDFQSLAEQLREMKPNENWSANKMCQWRLDCAAVANACQLANPNFDRGKFYDACAGGEWRFQLT